MYGKGAPEFSSLDQAMEVAVFAHKWQIESLRDIAVANFDLFEHNFEQKLQLYNICKILGNDCKVSQYFQVKYSARINDSCFKEKN